MTILQFTEVLRRFGVDVLLLALGVTLLTSLLKKTVMKSVNKKVFVFLPFGIGIIVYAVYFFLTRGGGCLKAEEVFGVFGPGIGCGSAATLYYVFYEQFLRGKTQMDPLLPLLECVPEDKREEAAAKIGESAKTGGLAAVKETLSSYADPPLSEEELSATAALLLAYFESIS